MKRRGFLRLAGAAAVVPVLPAMTAAPAAAAAAGYSRYMYGLAVFHAHTRATLTAADLVAKMRVPLATAEAMLGEMSARGMLAPVLHSGVARSAAAKATAIRPAARPNLRRIADALTSTETETDNDALQTRSSPDADAENPQDGDS